MCLLLLVAGLPALALPSAAAEPPSSLQAPAGAAEELLAREPALLARLEQLREIGRRYGGELWPGWNLLSTPIAVHDPGRLAVLIQHPSPPAHYVRVETPLVTTPVYVSTNTAGLMANTALPLNGAVTSMIAYQTLMTLEAEDALALCVHEIFHAYLQRQVPQKMGDILMVVFGRYPEFSLDNNALHALEGALLARALEAKEEKKARAFVERFLAARAARRRLLTADQVRFERGEEANEGLAQYIEYRFLGLPLKNYQGLPSLQRADRNFHGFRHNRLRQRRRLEALENLALAGDTLRQRLYPLGMAQAALLDRLRPPWKGEFERTGKFLDKLLVEAVAFPADNVSIQAYYQRALQVPGINWELIQAQARMEIADRTRQREKLYQELFPPGTAQLEVDITAVRQHFRIHGVNPNSLLQFADGRVLARFLVIDFGASEECALRVVNGAALFDPARNTYLLPVPPELLPEPDAPFPLEIQTRTLNVHVEKGTVLAAPNRRLIQAQPVPPPPPPAN